MATMQNQLINRKNKIRILLIYLIIIHSDSICIESVIATMKNYSKQGGSSIGLADTVGI